MGLSALEIENRVARVLQARMQRSGQLNGLDDEQLAGIGKALKKVAKKVGKVVKKVAPIALGAGALYLGAKVVGKVIKGKKAAPVAAAVAAPAAAAAVQQAVTSGALPPTPPAGAQLIDTAGQVATALIAAEGMPSAAADPGIQQIVRDAIAANMPQSYGSQGYVQSAPQAAPGAQYEQLPEVEITADRMKQWLIPGGIAAGLLVLLMMSNKRKG